MKNSNNAEEAVRFFSSIRFCAHYATKNFKVKIKFTQQKRKKAKIHINYINF